MRSFRLALSLAAALSLGGCLISDQDGERSHVNSPPPERMAFHFDSGYNRAIVWGRSAALVLLGLWIAGQGRESRRAPAVLLGTLPCLGVAGWLLLQGLGQIGGYRIDVEPDRLVLRLPGEEERSIAWSELQGLYVEGRAHDIDTGIETYEEYDRMELELASGERREVDLRPLSVEQRGSPWQAIARKAKLVEAPASGRR